MFRAIEEVYSRSDPKIWTDFELFTLGGGWVSMGRILGSRPRGRIAQFTEDIESLLKEEPLQEVEIPNAVEQKQAWSFLRKALKTNGLPTRDGKYRTQVDPDEFMLMSMNGQYFMFKHRGTRNHLGIDRQTGKLVTFSDTKPFYQGYYDESLDEPTRVSYREVQKGPFRSQEFASRLEAVEFASQLLNAEYAEIRWQMSSMEEDWEVELTGLFQALAEDCQACAESKLESITGTNLFKRPRGEKESKSEEWDCSEDGECMHVPSGFAIRIDVGGE
jgi:hypothetical protein